MELRVGRPWGCAGATHIKADLSPDGVGEVEVRKLLLEHAHHLGPNVVHLSTQGLMKSLECAHDLQSGTAKARLLVWCQMQAGQPATSNGSTQKRAATSCHGGRRNGP